MLVTFRTPHSPTITLFGEHALALLAAMGHSSILPGALAPEDVPAALARLRSALNGPAGEAAARSPGDTLEDPPIALATRGKALVDFLERAAHAGNEVMWSESS